VAAMRRGEAREGLLMVVAAGRRKGWTREGRRLSRRRRGREEQFATSIGSLPPVSVWQPVVCMSKCSVCVCVYIVVWYGVEGKQS